MKTIIGILAIIGLLYTCGFTISFKPFSINFTDWKTFLGYFLIVISISLINIDTNKKAYLKGYHDGGIYVIKEISIKLKTK